MKNTVIRKSSITKKRAQAAQKGRTFLLLCLVVVFAAAATVIVLRKPASNRVNASASGSPTPVATSASAAGPTRVSFLPTVPNHASTPSPAPPAMVWIPGGEFSMGAQDSSDMNDVGMNATVDSRPIHRVYVDGFFMDKTDVTNAQFA